MNLVSNINISYAVWFLPKNLPCQKITLQEKEWAKKLNFNKDQEYIYARRHLRRSLSNLFSVNSLNIPLYFPPGKPPKLKNDYGHEIISHCKDALVLA